MKDCLFCQLANSDGVIWENDSFYALKDLHPKAPTHLLVIPKTHSPSLDSFQDGDGLVEAIQALTAQMGLSDAYSVTINVGKAGGQDVFHVHAHIRSQRVVSDDQIG